MSERRQLQLLAILASVFVFSLLLFMVSLYASSAGVQATINTNSARRDAQMAVLEQGMQDIQKGNRAIGCILGISVDDRTQVGVERCFLDQGLTPP